jgi:prolyl oligopeptidase
MRPHSPPHLICRTAAAGLLLACSLSSAAEQPSDAAKPPAARVEIVQDTYFGEKVADPYRWMEAAGDERDRWLRAQNDYTRAWFGQQGAQRRQWFERIRALQSGTAATRFVSQAGDHYFFLETPADGDAARLVTQPLKGGERRVVFDPVSLSSAGRRVTLDFISPARDGRHVAMIVSTSGSEDWTIRVVETASGKLQPEILRDAGAPIQSWDAQGKGFYYTRYQPQRPGMAPSERYENQRVYYHALGTAVEKDVAVFGAGVDAAVKFDAKIEQPQVEASSDGHWLAAFTRRGTDNHVAMWLRDARKPAGAWRAVASHEDAVSAVTLQGDLAYAISARKQPNGAVLRFDARSETLADAKVWLSDPALVLSDATGWLSPAADALYVAGRRDGRDIVRALSYDKPGQAVDLPLGADGELIEFDSSAQRPGAILALQGPTLSPRIFRYVPGAAALVDTGIRKADPADFSRVETRRLQVPNGDVSVPLTLTGRRDLPRDGRNPVLLVTYGSYGAISPMWFSAADLAWYERGGIIAFAHVRGGGEKGDAWREAGRRNNKKNTVSDFLAVARWLVDQGYTTPASLGIAGKSAGGVIMSAAITQAPELFGAALIRVGVTDLLRLEHTEGGPANVNEFGTPTIAEDFRAMRALSGYANVKPGVAYPAVLLETGINDPRVPPWQLAKMTARLQAASSSGKPVLLRVDYDAGHGLGNSKLQVAELLADEYEFLRRNLRRREEARQ